MRPFRLQFLEAVGREDLLELLIGHLRVGDGHLAQERLQLAVTGLFQLLFDLFVGLRVDAADEETGDGVDVADRQVLLHPSLEPAQVCLHHLAVDVVGEEERDVDIDAVEDRLLDCRQSCGRRGDLHHDVRPLQPLEVPLRLGDRSLRVVRQRGADFDADESIAAFALVVDRPEDVRGVGNVLQHQLVVDLIARLVLRRKLPQLCVVVIAAADGLLEDRRIGRHAAQIVLLDHLLQPAGGDQPALHLVVPDTLANLGQLNEGVAHGGPPLQGRSISLDLSERLALQFPRVRETTGREQ